MTPSAAIGIVSVLVLVAANGFFVATELAVARIRTTQVRARRRSAVTCSSCSRAFPSEGRTSIWTGAWRRSRQSGGARIVELRFEKSGEA